MKNIFLLLIIFFFTNSFSQRCVSPNGVTGIQTTTANTYQNTSNSPTVYDETTPYVLNIFFTLVNNDIDQNSLTNQNIIDTPDQIETKFQECVKVLNVAYNPSRIYFKYNGYQVVQNQVASNSGWFWLYPPDFYDNPPGQGDLSQYRVQNNINIMFVDCSNCWNNNENPMIYTTWLAYPAFVADIQLFGVEQNLLAPKIVRQMGHTLSLYRTDEAYPHVSPSNPLWSSSQCERVSRIPNSNPNVYNATFAGDDIADTAAQPAINDSFFLNNCGDYIYEPTRTNCFGEAYEGITNDNYMNSNVISTCYKHFTPGQTRRMREFILHNSTIPYAEYTDFYFPYLGYVDTARNTVESLYQPYSATNIMGDYVVSITDNGNGTATVCRNRLEQHKFQKGFDYIFPENYSPDPLTATINDIPVVTQHTLDYPVTILQLAPGFTNLTTNTGYANLNCTRGVVCQIEPFKLGVVFSTQILGSMNMTIKELNEMQVKDPNLYDNFLLHYYYIVKKQTESGAQTQETFYKQ
jgi:hypothetical protein